MAIRRKQIISPHIRFAASSRGPYANKLGGGLYAKSFGLREAPADFIAFSELNGVIKALVRGQGAVTFERQTEATVIDHERLVKTALVNEIRHELGRRAHNILTESSGAKSEDMTTAQSTAGLSSIEKENIHFNAQSFARAMWTGMNLVDDDVVRCSVEAKNISGNGIFIFRANNSSPATSVQIQTTSEWVRYSALLTMNSSVDGYLGLQNSEALEKTIAFRNLQFEKVTGQSNQNPSEYVSIGVGTGPELQEDDYATGTGNWTAYGNNTIENDSGALKFTYVDNANGGYVYLREAADLNQDLVPNKTYLFTCEAKVNTGAVTLWVQGGPSAIIDANISNTDWETITGTFVATSATNNYLRPQDMNAGEIFWMRNLSFKEADHGAFVDGVRYYARSNPVEVDPVTNVVTETAATTPITDYRTLFEPASINRVASPMDFTAGANWTGTGNMDGSESSLDSSIQGYKHWRIEATVGSTGVHSYYSSSYTKPATTDTWIAKITVRADTGVPWVAVGAENSAQSNFFRRFFNATTGVAGTSNASTWSFLDSGSEVKNNGDVEIWVKGTATSSDTTIQLRVWAADSDNGDFFNLPAGEGFWVQGAQLEQQEIPTTLITQGNTTRTGDNPSPMFDYANWSQVEGTWFVDAWLTDSSNAANRGVFAIWNSEVSVLFTGAGNLKTYHGSGPGSQIAIPNLADMRQVRLLSEFSTDDNELIAGARDITGDSAWAWDPTPDTYDGAFNTNSVINIAFNAAVPIRLRDLKGYITRKGKDWVEDNL